MIGDKPMAYCLAIDIGASGGRHILGEIADGNLVMTEVYRFENGMKELNGSLVWDIDELFENVVKGLEKCKELGKIPATVSIDTWGVDYVLLDEKGKEIPPCYAYRDSRTAGAPEEVYKIIPQTELFKRTGIPKQNYNTVFQLWRDKKSGRLDNASHMLLLPDYLKYKLTGKMASEYTICTTTGLVNADTKNWDDSIIDALGFDRSLFVEISAPCTLLGNLREEIKSRVGFDCLVLHCPAHDTASAVAACPVDDSSVFISSGTWSLVGTENLEAVTDESAMLAGLANEGGINYRYRFLKNIMGMWLFQSIRKELDKKYTYDEMMEMAMASSFTEKIDPTDDLFLAPESMINAVRTYLGKPDLPLGDVLSSIYHSLAQSYDMTVREIENISGKKVKHISIVGGGSRDRYLNRLTREYTGKTVSAGPVECTATGNIISQLMYLDENLSLGDARALVKHSFNIEEVK